MDFYTKLYHALKGRYLRWVIVGMLMCVLFALSCVTKKNAYEQTISKEHVQTSEQVIVEEGKAQVTIPMSIAQLELPVMNLHKLPPGAVYTSRSGQAKVDLRIRNDTIFVDAKCDSLQMLVDYYRKQAMRLKSTDNQIENVQEEKVEKTPIEERIWMLATGCLSIVIIVIILKKKLICLRKQE